MGLDALFTSVLASSGASSFVQILSVVGGLSGVAAVITAIATWRSGDRKSKQEDKTVAISELEKAVPGMGTIIAQWQTLVQQLQADKDALRAERDALRDERDELRAELEGR